MKEDYLWDKSGNDPEIEKLENALKAFRQKDTTPPVVPAKTSTIEEKRNNPWGFFRLGFASFACFALAIISLGVFQFTQNETQSIAKIDLKKSVIEPVTKKNDYIKQDTISKEIFTEEKQNKPTVVKATFKPTKKKKRKIINRKKVAKKSTHKTAIRKKVKTNLPEQKVEISELTAEEKYAYNQLMKALAITSSKLKIVKDKVQGLDNKPVGKSLR